MNLIEGIKAISQILKLILSVLVVLIAFVLMLQFNPEAFHSKKVDPANWKPRSVLTDLEGESQASLIRFGHELITKTPQYIGPLSADEKKRLAGNNLTCQNCHLEAGTKPGAGSFVGVFNRFPQFRGRENQIGSLEERINGCMQRSMNGDSLPETSLEMKAMIAYIKWLSEDVPEEKVDIYKGFVKVELPNVKADLLTGKSIYEKNCVTCHGADGQGVRLNENSLYQYPPLWGNDTFNDGAGMHRVITAAEFIKGNMPYLQATWDNPVLSDEEAYHVAAYINSFDRPEKANKELDFPDKKLKPVSTPYGPWTDTFSAEQHKYGPFQPIMAYYEKEFGIKKSK
ncbi:thiosulfate dehydrogenase [Roseivirga ehrenbergii]|uniref:Cytochrome C n=1 Tax=Roseivirga ehrenbergii (strain DSM 102268 / JCM 13514 / KCTC 12282 / NCIMB 14502 / KMM 6017) TaxID=279360 RepID=A0A150X7R0_ROSEK|nr:c-type cytochrome [Roseivirga ehrenbergii]KYG74777.1 cytochrome C [Roseivirga ehrenbergii]TCL13892.1 thiosulfate dehydrogenase [Roseivirga ehrenbergii]